MISVIMSTYKEDERLLRESIESILNQTYRDFEYIIILDYPDNDVHKSVIEEYALKDDRIHFYINEKNMGLTDSLNRGLSLCHGEYIARMDADDIMHTERLRIQLKRMKKNPDIIVCGTWARFFSDNGKEKNTSHLGYGIIHEPVFELFKHNMLLHPSVMIKKEFLFNHNIEYQNYPYVEDYKLWFDIAKTKGLLFVEPQELLMIRRSNTQITVIKEEEMCIGINQLRREILLHLLSIHNNKTLNNVLSDFENLEKNKWMSNEDIFRFFVNLFNKIQRETLI